MTKEVPIAYVRANQIGIVLMIVSAAITQQPLLITLLWVIEVSGLLFGQKGNLFVRAAKPLIRKYVKTTTTESKELNRFNNSLAVIFLSGSLLLFVLEWSTAAYILAGMLALAALSGVFGYCVGCFLYYQYKLLKQTLGFKF